MKNRWMKGLAMLTMGAGIMAGLAGCEKEEYEEVPFYQVILAIGLPGPDGDIGGAGSGPNLHEPTEGEVYVYDSEENYILKQNPIQITSFRDEYLILHFSDTLDLWIYAKQDNLTSTRYSIAEGDGNYHGRLYDGKISTRFRHKNIKCVDNYNKQCYDYYSVMMEIGLTVEPAKLQINVVSNGLPVSGADVQLYFSQEAYEQDLKAQEDLEQVRATYGYPSDDYGDPAADEAFFFNTISRYFTKITDANGAAYFPNLEPKRYWFKVTKDGMSNSTGTFTIAEPLDNTSEATKSITVGIN